MTLFSLEKKRLGGGLIHVDAQTGKQAWREAGNRVPKKTEPNFSQWRQRAQTGTHKIPFKRKNYFFTVNVIKHWNMLPRGVPSPSLERLQTQLDVMWATHSRLYLWQLSHLWSQGLYPQIDLPCPEYSSNSIQQSLIPMAHKSSHISVSLNVFLQAPTPRATMQIPKTSGTWGVPHWSSHRIHKLHSFFAQHLVCCPV